MTEHAAPGPPPLRVVATGATATDDPGAVTRGFLFADVRDYTSYVETHGDRAGAALLARYRSLVRSVVAAAHGAEIRTEGDSFFIVFDSVSAAVRAGLAILDAAAATTDDADPLRVGVGVHAGETVETVEGYVGSAVNIAARLCAQAKAGELVVSETVRGVVRTSLDLDFEPLGARRLKGIAEPIACYRVRPRAAAPLGRARAPRVAAGRGRFAAFGLVIAVAVIAVAGVTLALAGGGEPVASPATSFAPSPAGAVAGSPAGATAPAAPGATASAALDATPKLAPFPTEAEAELLAALPQVVVSSCRRGATSDDAILAGFVGIYRVKEAGNSPASIWPVTPPELGGITCQPPAGAARLYVAEPERPDALRPTGYGWADEYIGRLAGRWAIPSGSCAVDARAYERWRTALGTGLLACMNPYQGRPWIYFTFGKGHYLAFATRDDSDYDALYAWWEQLKTFLP